MKHLLCWLGFHQVHYTWKTKYPYCARREGCDYQPEWRP
ncbi:hypothetical protein ABIB35_001510 [Arthrobacter sp. UYP6]